MLDQTLDYRTLTVTRNATSHNTPCRECQDNVRHNHVAPGGVPHYHIVGTQEMHEIILAGGRGSHVTHATPSCTCTNGKVQRARNKPAVCYHVESALVLFQRWFDGLQVVPVITSLTPDIELWQGDEYDQLEAGDGPVLGDNCCYDCGSLRYDPECICPCHSQGMTTTLPAALPFPLSVNTVKYIDCGLTRLFDKVFSE